MLQTGCVVISAAGKDRDALMAVVRQEHGGVWVVDGRHRRIERPKRKKIRHVSFVAKSRSEEGRRLRQGEKLSNSEVRRALRQEEAPTNAE